MLAQTTSVDKLVQTKNLSEFLSALGYLLTNTINSDIQRMCLKFLQVYFRALTKTSAAGAPNGGGTVAGAKSKYAQAADVKINESLLEYLIECSVSAKIQLKQVAIDLIYTYMKFTDDLNACFAKFIKHGIETRNLDVSRHFIESTLHILVTEEFAQRDFALLVRALVKQAQTNPRCEPGAYRCLAKIESVVRRERFNAYVSKLPPALRNAYLEKRGG